MAQSPATPTLPLWISLYLPAALFSLGALFGWLMGSQRPRAALLTLIVGGLVVFIGYVALIAGLGMFDVRNEIH